MADKKAPAEEEEWTPLKRPLLLLGSLSLASSFVAYKKKTSQLVQNELRVRVRDVRTGDGFVRVAGKERGVGRETLFFVLLVLLVQ